MNNNVKIARIGNNVRTDTDFQFRKHYTQMNDDEILRCAFSIKGISRLEESQHVKDKDITYDKKIIYKFLGSDIRLIAKNIIEYNEKYDAKGNRWTQRVLFNVPKVEKVLNSKTDKIEDCYLKVVVDVTTKVIISVYYNTVDDNHKSLDVSKYQPEMQVRIQKVGGYKKINPKLRESIKNKFK